MGVVDYYLSYVTSIIFLMRGERKMQPTIDKQYLRHCADYIPIVLPRPRRRKPRLLTGDGEMLPVITVETDE